jgi:hypothetical protein
MTSMPMIADSIETMLLRLFKSSMAHIPYKKVLLQDFTQCSKTLQFFALSVNEALFLCRALPAVIVILDKTINPVKMKNKKNE